jgi:hypothetical protein
MILCARGVGAHRSPKETISTEEKNRRQWKPKKGFLWPGETHRGFSTCRPTTWLFLSWPRLTSQPDQGVLQMFRAGDFAAGCEAVLPPGHWARFSSKITRSTSPGVLVLAAQEERCVVLSQGRSGSDSGHARANDDRLCFFF